MIDAHVHIFPSIRGRIKGGPVRDLGFGRVSMAGQDMTLFPCESAVTCHSPETLLERMDATGVEKAVLFQGPFYGECNDYVAEAVRKYPERLRALAYLDPWEKEWDKKLGSICDSSLYRGIKLEFSEATGLCGLYPGARLDELRLKVLWKELERRQMVLALDMGAVGSASYQTQAVCEIAMEYPGLKIIIPHLGQPTRHVLLNEKLRQEWLFQVALANLPNVWFDTSALPHKFLNEGDRFPGISECIRCAIEMIGVEKMIWGTDIPGLLSTVTYSRLVEMASEHVSFLSREDREKYFSKNAQTVYWLD